MRCRTAHGTSFIGIPALPRDGLLEACLKVSVVHLRFLRSNTLRWQRYESGRRVKHNEDDRVASPILTSISNLIDQGDVYKSVI